jgi:tetratricopeptide (TPR) repeat protein
LLLREIEKKFKRREYRAMTKSEPNRAALAVLFVFIALAAGTAAAGEEEVELRGRTLFAGGQYPQALDIYVRLYAETSHPTYMRNIGRCYQRMGEPDKAIQAFREYLHKAPSLDTKQRGEVEGFIAEMEALKRQRQEGSPPPPSLSVQPAPEPTAPLLLSAGGPAAPSAPTPKRSVRRTAGYVVGAAGLATGAAALLHLLWNKGRNDRFQEEMSTSAALASSIHNQSAVTVTLGVASAALLATGIALIVTAPEVPATASATVPAAASTQAVLLAPASVAWRMTW